VVFISINVPRMNGKFEMTLYPNVARNFLDNIETESKAKKGVELYEDKATIITWLTILP
jgi:hypothetical protein